MIQPFHDDIYSYSDTLLQKHPLTIWLKRQNWNWFPHQIEAANCALFGNDVLVLAPTGAGKTLAGFLSSFLDITKNGSNGNLHTLYISPLKALAVDCLLYTSDAADE